MCKHTRKITQSIIGGSHLGCRCYRTRRKVRSVKYSHSSSIAAIHYLRLIYWLFTSLSASLSLMSSICYEQIKLDSASEEERGHMERKNVYLNFTVRFHDDTSFPVFALIDTHRLVLITYQDQFRCCAFLWSTNWWESLFPRWTSENSSSSQEHCSYSTTDS